MAKSKQNIEFHNRKATFQYSIIDKYSAGMMLVGTEVKALREGKVNMGDTFCVFIKGELWLRKLFIGDYSNTGFTTHDPYRPRKLLLNKRELKKLQSKIKEKGLTIIPTKIYATERGHFKIDIALAKGKKVFDKRESIKSKDNKRQLDRIKKFNR